MVDSSGQAGARVTPEMEEVGRDLIEELYGVVSASYLAERVYIAMAHARTRGVRRAASRDSGS